MDGLAGWLPCRSAVAGWALAGLLSGPLATAAEQPRLRPVAEPVLLHPLPITSGAEAIAADTTAEQQASHHDQPPRDRGEFLLAGAPAGPAIAPPGNKVSPWNRDDTTPSAVVRLPPTDDVPPSIHSFPAPFPSGFSSPGPDRSPSAAPAPQPSWTSTAPAPSQAVVFDAARLQASQTIAAGAALAEKGALFAARQQFVQALRIVAQARDIAHGDRVATTALAAGLRALDEADGFIPPGDALEAEVDLAALAAAHRTPILRGVDLTRLTPAEAMWRYQEYGQQQLAAAMGGEAVGSQALLHLGKTHMFIGLAAADGGRLHDSRAIALHQAALLVDGANAAAANELGVLLARHGHYEPAVQALRRAVEAAPEPYMWRNLASVHDRQGEANLAQLARREAELLTQTRGGVARPGVQWLSPEEFSRAAAAPQPAMSLSPAVAPQASAPRATDRARLPGKSSW